MTHHYEITVADRTPRAPDAPAVPDLGFHFENHDDLNQIVERLRDKALFGSDEEVKTFVVGLKLLGSVLLQHRGEPLFQDFAASFGSFMKSLKSNVRSTQA